MLDSIDKSFNCSFPTKEKWSVFFAKVQKSAVWADRGDGWNQSAFGDLNRVLPRGQL
jgi:hypothetical protein